VVCEIPVRLSPDAGGGAVAPVVEVPGRLDVPTPLVVVEDGVDEAGGGGGAPFGSPDGELRSDGGVVGPADVYTLDAGVSPDGEPKGSLGLGDADDG